MRDLLLPTTLMRGVSALAFGATLLLQSADAHAQQSTAEARRAAGEAFDRGTSSMLASDFRAAAHFFEQAYRLAPASVALKQAIRAHDRAGNAFRAANLALRLRESYPNDGDGQAVADDVIGRYGNQYVEVAASCEGCAVLVNEALVGEDVHGTIHFFIQPGAASTITGSFPTGNVSAEARGEAGGSVELEAFEAPPPPPPSETDPDPSGEPTVIYREAERGGIPRAVFFSLAGATAAVGGVTIWSGVDTLSGVDAYEAMPTRDAYDDGHKKELRTNILIGATGALAAGALVVGILTDWDGDDDEAAPTSRRIQDLTATVAPTVGGAGVLLGGRF